MPMLTNSNRTKKRLLVGFTAGFLAINGAQGIYQALLMDRRKRQFLAYLKNDASVTFGNFHRGSVYGYKHIRSSQDVYFAVRQLADERFIVRRHAQIWGLPESYLALISTITFSVILLIMSMIRWLRKTILSRFVLGIV